MIKIIFSFIFFMLLIWGIIQGLKLGWRNERFLKKVFEFLLLFILAMFLLAGIVVLF